GAGGVLVVVPLRLDLRIRVAGVIEPARLADEVPEVVFTQAGVLAGEDQRVGVVKIIVLPVEDAVAVANHLAFPEWAGRDDSVAVNLGSNDTQTIEQGHRVDDDL